MSKDPAFLFYPNDWIGGTMGMTLEEKGAYMELLILQFNRGHMTTHMIGQTVGQLWDKIKDKFKVDEKGCYYNERLEKEIARRKRYVESRFNNREGINQYTKRKKKKQGHMTTHKTDDMSGLMENENENENENINRAENENEKRKKNEEKEIVEIFNSHTDFPKVAKMTETRKRRVKKLLLEYGRDGVIQVIMQARDNEFMNGRNQRGWVANFDWITKPENFIKIMEGSYSRRTPTTGKPSRLEKLYGKN